MGASTSQSEKSYFPRGPSLERSISDPAKSKLDNYSSHTDTSTSLSTSMGRTFATAKQLSYGESATAGAPEQQLLLSSQSATALATANTNGNVTATRRSSTLMEPTLSAVRRLPNFNIGSGSRR
jgi:hypothetical protein